MWEELVSKTQELREHKQKRDEKSQELSDLKADTFGTDSAEVEERARSFFDDLSDAESNGQAERIDELKTQLTEIDNRISELKNEILQRVTELKFPFDRTIDQGSDEVFFPFSKEIPEATVDEVLAAVRNELGNGTVEFRTDGVAVATDDVEEAMDAVEAYASNIRQAARHELNLDDYVDELADRDIKIRRMLYELYETEEPLAKKDLELRTGVGSGGLRGVLYHVLDRDPYLVKTDKKYTLSEIGHDVIEKYIEEYGVPPQPESDEDETESDETESDDETQATLNSAGESDE